jgi:hypothetical protein
MLLLIPFSSRVFCRRPTTSKVQMQMSGPGDMVHQRSVPTYYAVLQEDGRLQSIPDVLYPKMGYGNVRARLTQAATPCPPLAAECVPTSLNPECSGQDPASPALKSRLLSELGACTSNKRSLRNPVWTVALLSTVVTDCECYTVRPIVTFHPHYDAICLPLAFNVPNLSKNGCPCIRVLVLPHHDWRPSSLPSTQQCPQP